MDSPHLTSTKPPSKADDLFHLQILTLKAEAELSDLLESIPKPFDWSDFSYDYYDSSLEIYGVPDTFKLTGVEAAKLREFGFKSVYMHKVDNRHEYNDSKSRKQQGERFYNL